MKKKKDEDWITAWELCPDCEEFWCLVHQMHAADCPCPEIEIWADVGISPYDPAPSKLVLAVVMARRNKRRIH
jgi:hypothetical protein